MLLLLILIFLLLAVFGGLTINSLLWLFLIAVLVLLLVGAIGGRGYW